MAAAAASIRTKTRIVRAPSRPTARTSAAEAMPVMRSETTSGTTVMRMALTHRVPIGAMASAAASNDGVSVAEMRKPPAIARRRASRTRLFSFISSALSGSSLGLQRLTPSLSIQPWLTDSSSTGQSSGYLASQGCRLRLGVTRYEPKARKQRWSQWPSHHQVAAVDIERRAGDIARGLRGGEADQVSDFYWRAESWHGVAGGEPGEGSQVRVLVRELGIDHPRADRVDRDAVFPKLLGGGASEAE